MERLGYYNGEWGPLEEMKVPFLDRASFFGDGVYDATITSQGVVLYEDDHIDRFFNSCAIMEIEPDFTKDELRAVLRDMVSKVSVSDTFLYWQVTRGTAQRAHQFPEAKPNLWIMVVPEPLEDLSWDCRAVTVEDTRFFHCNAKTLNLLPNVRAQQRAQEKGCEEAIFVRPDGFVTECAHSNVHILKNGALVTHPADNLILPGIARKHLIAACAALSIPVEERPFSKEELFAADEVVISSSSTFARGCCEIDGQEVGGKDRPLLCRLQDYLTQEFNAYIASTKAE